MFKTKIGSIDLEFPIFNASGVYCKTHENLNELDNTNYCGALISKSCTLESRIGNNPPIYWDNNNDVNSLSINSSGLPNNGYQYYIQESFANYLSKPYFLSVSGLCEEDNLKIIEDALKSKYVSGIELNLSCPNIQGKSQIGYDFEAMNLLLEKVNNIFLKNNLNNIQFGVKLPPYFDEMHFIEVANIINKYNIKFITCINSLGNGLIVDIDNESTVIRPKSGFGGIGGKYIKPIALANVRKFSKLTNCDVIGCGGISSGQDAFEHILCGAKAIQVGTQLYMEGINVFKRIMKELEVIILSKGYSNIDDFCGKLKEI